MYIIDMETNKLIAASLASHPYGESAGRAEIGLTEATEAPTTAWERGQYAKMATDALSAPARCEQWDAVYRAAICAAAQAVQARDWGAKRQALAVAAQADKNRDVVLGAIFGSPQDVPAQYSAFAAAGAAITREQSSAAKRLVAADKPVAKAAPAAKPWVRQAWMG